MLALSTHTGSKSVASIIQIRGRWRAQVRRRGFPDYTKTFDTKAAAQTWARQVEADIDRGSVPSARAVQGRGYVVADLLDDYIKLRAASREIHDKSNEHYMLLRLRERLGELDATRLRPDDLVGYAQARSDDGAGPYTVNMEVSKLGTIMRMVAASRHMALPDAVQQARPLLSHLHLIGGGGKRERRPTEDELAQILSHLEKHRGRVFADAVRFAVGTGMRRGEITRLLWADLDEAKHLVLVRDRKDPREKKGNHQWIPLLSQTDYGCMWALVQAQPKVSDRIFPIGESALSKYFTWACRALSIPDLHLHDMRHHAISRLFEMGYRIEQVALVSGHRSWVHLKRYTNLRPEDLHSGPSGG